MSRHVVRKAAVTGLVLCLLSVMVYGTFVAQRPAYAASSVTINGATLDQVIDGFGSSEAFGEASSIESAPASAQQQMLNLLFSTTSGAGLSILRNIIPSDSSHTIEPNAPSGPTATPTYTWSANDWGQVAFTQQAEALGVNQIYADAWSAPGFMKTNGSEANGGTLCGAPSASCSSGDWRQAYANYLVQYIKDYQSAGITLSDVGAFNEPNFVATYSSMIMNPTQTADFMTVLGPTLKAAGLSTQIVCCDPEGWNLAQSYATGITSNSVANSYVNTLSSHGYTGAPNSTLTGIGSKHAWETEWSTFDNFDSSWDDGSDASGFTWAQSIYTGLTAANLNAFLYWWGVSTSTDNEQLIQLNGSTVTPTGRLWAMANYSRFIRPGAVRIGSTSGDSNLLVTAYKNTNGTVSIVVLNTSTSAIATTYSLQNTGVANGTTVTPYLTNSSSNTAAQATTSVSSGAFSATIPARSLVTYVLNGTSSGVTPTPTTGTTPTPTPTAGTTPIPTPTQGVTPTPTSVAGASCSVHYAITNQWPGGFGTALTITNTGTTAINGWSLQFSFPNGQAITQLWNGSFTQSGSTVTITNLSYNGSIPIGGSPSSEPGFNGSWTTTNSPPTAFTLNGSPCSVV